MGKLKLSTKQKLPQFHLGWPFHAVEEKTVISTCIFIRLQSGRQCSSGTANSARDRSDK